VSGSGFGGGKVIDEALTGIKSVCTADVDGDGDLDVIGASPAGGRVSWWENPGAGSTWDEHTIISTLLQASSVFPADVDRDGDMDVVLAAVHVSGADVAWWENVEGDGLAWSQHTIDGAAGALFVSSVTVADLDRDGDPDVVGSMNHDLPGLEKIGWWENTDGLGLAWSRHAVDTEFLFAQSVMVLDVDCDGAPDIVGSRGNIQGGGIAWWRNSAGDATVWVPNPVGSAAAGAHHVDAGDVDGDGDVDLAVGWFEHGDVVWWENETGDGISWTEHVVDEDFAFAEAVRLFDLDLDGDLDVLGAATEAPQPGGEIAWWENTLGDGSTWSRHGVDGDYDNPEDLLVVDLDDDGKPDVLAASVGLPSGDITWWPNLLSRCHTEFDTTQVVSAAFNGARAVVAADVDCDGDVDIAAAGSENPGPDGRVSVWTNVGGGTGRESHSLSTSFNGASHLQFADLDRDGDLDVVGVAFRADDVAWWEQTDDPDVWPRHDIDSSFESGRTLVTGDLDRDGDLDVVGASSAVGITWWENAGGDGATWTRHDLGTAFGHTQTADLADIDGDGDLDIVSGSGFAGVLGWWRNLDGDASSWQPMTIYSDPLYPLAVAALACVDVDHDGDEDVVVAEVFAGVIWWENDDDGLSWTERPLDDDLVNVGWMTVSDIDADGDTDIVVSQRAGVNGKIVWEENASGDASDWTAHTVATELYDPLGVAVADVDRDGHTDILGAMSLDDDVSWWPAYASTCVGDLDGDCAIGFGDLLIVLTDWGCDDGCKSDLDGNGTVAFGDLLFVLANFGPCS